MVSKQLLINNEVCRRYMLRYSEHPRSA
ncbi:hypothetical protein M3J09_008214 [Ascochyta lentis]